MTAIVLPQSDIPAEVLDTIWRRRKAVFIDQMHWPLTHIDGREIDEWDGPDTLMILAGEPLAFSMRIIPEQHCMVRKLWPDGARYIRPGSHELSRWVSHGTHSLQASRAAMASAIAEMRRREWWDIFCVSTDRVARLQVRIGFNPTEQGKFGPDVNLCKWNLRVKS